MTIEVKVPELPESVADGILMEWHCQVGDQIRRDDNLVDLETDKVVLEIPAPADGRIVAIQKVAGDVVSSGEVLAVLDTSASGDAEPVKTAEVQGQPEQENKEATQAAAPATSPAVRKLLAEHGIEASNITGTGKGGRIVKQDVLNFVEQQQQTELRDHTMSMSTIPMDNVVDVDSRREERVPMTRLRTRIAERLVQSQQTAAILTTFNEVNMQPVMDLRSEFQDRFIRKHDVKLGFMSFFVKACTEALKQFPVVNASIDGSDIIYHGYYDIGIAVGSPRGLVVPVLRDTDAMSYGDIEKQIKDYGSRAQDGKLTMEELTGGTFSITNGGVFGSMLSTPIINPPQSAILGMHSIQQRAMVENGEVVARPVMYLALSYDHRIIDGREAVQFLVHIKQYLESPAAMLLDI